MKQFQAAYFLSSINDLFLNPTEKGKIKKIVFQLSHFNIETDDKLLHKAQTFASEIKVINNIISRGLPAPPSKFIQELFSTSFVATKKNVSDINKISYPFVDDKLKEELKRAVHIIDPRIKKEDFNIKFKGKNADFKDDFFYSYIPEYLGDDYLQLIETDLNYNGLLEKNTVVKNKSKLLSKYKSILSDKIDFAFRLPYHNNYNNGIPIEIDNSPVETNYDFEVSSKKNEFTNQIAWQAPLSINTEGVVDSSEMLKPLINFTYNDYFDTISKNYRSPLYKSTAGLDAMQLALSPIGIARIQKTIIEYLLSGNLNIKAKKWKIAVIERDVPMAFLAFQDLKLLFNNLFTLKGEELRFPEVDLTIYRTSEFKAAKLNKIYQGKIKLIDNFDTTEEFDILIDVSVIQRSSIANKNYKTKAKHKAIISSVLNVNTRKKLLTDKFIEYSSILNSKTKANKEEKINSLKYFIENIFHKEILLPGQIKIIDKALQGKNTLAVLSANSGKTISFQLASILQAGISVIINPINSASTVQKQNLQLAGLDNIEYLRDSYDNEEELEQIYDNIEHTNPKFLFVSPELLRIKSFRNLIYRMDINKSHFSYFIVNQAHSISEWSHDFRTEYNSLGEISNKLFKITSNKSVPIIALSANAGFSTISEIQSELSIDEANTLIINKNNSNIDFSVIDVSSDVVIPSMQIEQVKKLIGSRKQVHFNYLIEKLYPKGQPNNKNSSLIYCPQAYGNYGITDTKKDGLADKLTANFEDLKIGWFLGATDDNTDNIPLRDAIKSEKYYSRFANNNLDVLLATKAFGVGMNKKDIRNVVFFNMPESLEGFIQQTYRAGRDGKPTKCVIFHDNQEMSVPKDNYLHERYGIAKTNIDKYVCYESLLRKYKGKEKDTASALDLLTEITSNKESYANLIEDAVFYEFRKHIKISFQPENNPSQIYINTIKKTYGYINIKDRSLHNEESDFDPVISLQILAFINNKVNNICKEKSSEIIKCLTKEIHQPKSKGIASYLENMNTGEVQEIVIPFKNNSVIEIEAILKSKISETFTKELIWKIYDRTHSLNEFIAELNEISNIIKDPKKPQVKIIVSRLYYKIRRKKETINAIYKFTKIGVIEDYIIDNNRNEIIVKIKKKSDEIYLINLYNYIDKFLLKEKFGEIKFNEKKIKGSKIEKAIKIYNNFIYDYILQDKFNSVEVLDQLINKIDTLNNKGKKGEANHLLNEFLNNYFSNKYSNTEFSSIVGAEALNEENQNFETLKSYIIKTSFFKENWTHLHNSTTKIADENKNHFIALLLNAYSELMIGENDEQNTDFALDQIARGFIKMRQTEHIDTEVYNSNIELFLEYLYDNRSDLKEHYQAIMQLRMHYIWLKDFNKKYLKAY